MDWKGNLLTTFRFIMSTGFEKDVYRRRGTVKVHIMKWLTEDYWHTILNAVILHLCTIPYEVFYEISFYEIIPIVKSSWNWRILPNRPIFKENNSEVSRTIRLTWSWAWCTCPGWAPPCRRRSPSTSRWTPAGTAGSCRPSGSWPPATTEPWSRTAHAPRGLRTLNAK